MKVNAGDLDMDKERRKRRRDDGGSGERKKRCKKNDLELMEGDGRDSDWGKERGKRHRHHGSKEISRQRHHGSKEISRHRHHGSKEISRHRKKVSRKEKSREVESHPYLSGGKKKCNVESDSDDSERDKKCINWNMELFKGSESKGQYDTGRGSGWRREKGDPENSDNASDGGKTTWHRDQFKGSARKERTCSDNSIRRENIDNQEMIQSNFNSEDMKFIEDQGWEQNLDRWVPTRDCDEEYEEVKNDSKKRKSAWLIEEAEKQQLSPVTLSDVEFSASFDSRIGNREFIVAQDYCALKAEPEGHEKKQRKSYESVRISHSPSRMGRYFH